MLILPIETTDIMEELLKRKIRILERQVKLRDLLIESLKIKCANGHSPPLEGYMDMSHFNIMSQQHEDYLRPLNLEIENTELRRHIAQLQAKD